jgi:hypothetical protein
MKKKDILKLHKMTEEEFYKKFPTEESYMEAMGSFFQSGGTAGSGRKTNLAGYDAAGFPVDSTGRRLTPEEQLGFSRPGYSYGNTGIEKTYTSSGTNKAALSLTSPVWDKTLGINPVSSTPVIQNSGETFEEAYLRTNGQPLTVKQKGGENVMNTWAPDFFNSNFIMQNGGDPSVPYFEPNDSLKIFRSLVKKKHGGPAFPGQTQQNIIDTKKNDFLGYIRDNTMDAIAREENMAMHMGYVKSYGGYKAQDGMEVEGSPENDAFWSNIYGQGNSQPQNQPFEWNFQGAPQAQFTTPESIGIQNNNVIMGDPANRPYTPGKNNSQGGKNSYDYRSLEPEVNWGIAGMNAVASLFELAQAKKNEDKFKMMQGADNQFAVTESGNRGDYDQFGNFRPDNKVPVQFAGQNFGHSGSPYRYQQGGEYYMTDDQVNEIMRNGGEIEFLD